jgi:hypothetical protein
LFDCRDNSPLADAQVILKDGNGKIWKTTTNANGRYSFEMGSEDHEPLVLSASKESYLDTTSSFKVENIDESDLLIDKLTNNDVCIEKKPEPKPEPVLVIKAEDVVRFDLQCHGRIPGYDDPDIWLYRRAGNRCL